MTKVAPFGVYLTIFPLDNSYQAHGLVAHRNRGSHRNKTMLEESRTA